MQFFGARDLLGAGAERIPYRERSSASFSFQQITLLWV